MVEEWSCLQARVYFRKEVTLIICLLIDLKLESKRKKRLETYHGAYQNISNINKKEDYS